MSGPLTAVLRMSSFLRFSWIFLAVCGNGMVSAGTTPEGLQWLKENSQKEGVITTSSGAVTAKLQAHLQFSQILQFTLLFTGLQYKVVRSGDVSGKQPGVNDACLCHYRVSLS